MPRCRLAPVLLACVPMLACPPDSEEPGDEATPPLPLPHDVDEVEPNDEVPQALGVVALPWVVAGTSSGCGSDGSWEGSDTDLLSFALAEPAIVPIDLQADGADLDLLVWDPDSHLMADLDGSDAFGEQVTISIGPGATYTLEIRCWMGDEDAAWRLVLGTE